MLAKRLQVELLRWYPDDYSEARDHDHELEVYLWFDGRLGYKLFSYGTSDTVPAPGYFGQEFRPVITPLVVPNRFKCRLVAIERDGPQWLDPDDRAKGEFFIDLDKDPPRSQYLIVAGATDTDLQVRVEFAITSLEYVEAPELGEASQGIQDRTNWPYPWGGTPMLFEHWLGLGRRTPVPMREENVHSRGTYNVIWRDGSGRLTIRKEVRTVYRYDIGQLGAGHDTISSVYLPRSDAGLSFSLTLYEHGTGDPRFSSGGRKTLSAFGLHDLSKIGFNDRLSALDFTVRHPPRGPGPN